MTPETVRRVKEIHDWFHHPLTHNTAPLALKYVDELVAAHQALHAQAVALASLAVKTRYNYWKASAEYADDPSDHETIHREAMKHDDLYRQAQALLEEK